MHEERYYPVTLNGVTLAVTPDYIEGESLWSYITRLARSNGFEDETDFIKDVFYDDSKPSWKQTRKWKYDITTPWIYKRITIEGTDLILRTTPFGVMRPFLSWRAQMERVCAYASEWKQIESGFRRPASYATEIRICPECEKEDEIFHHHIIHQAPGMKICPIHGCALHIVSDEGERTPIHISKEEAKKAEDISRYLYALYCSDTGESLERLFRVMLTRLGTRYFADGNPWLVANRMMKDPYYADLFSRYPKLHRFLDDSDRFDQMMPDQIIPVISRSFRDPDDFISEMKQKKLWEKTTKHILTSGNGFRLVGPYNENVLRVRCTECGTEFPITPLALNLGVSCPCCNPDAFSRSEINRIDAGFRLSMIPRFVSDLERKLGLKQPQSKGKGKKGKAKKAANGAKKAPARSCPEYMDKVNKYIETHRLIFLADLENLGDPRTISNYVSRLKRSEVLERIDIGLYCKVKDRPPVREILYEKFCARNGHRIGAPICDSLFIEIGCRISPPRYAFVLYNDGVSERHHDIRKVDGIPVDIYYSPVPITEENWKVISLIMTLKQWDIVTKSSIKAKQVLSGWIESCGITADDVLEFGNHFVNTILKRTVYFIRKGA